MFHNENELILCISAAILVSVITVLAYTLTHFSHANNVTANITEIRSQLLSQFNNSIGLGNMTQGDLIAVIPSDWRMATNNTGFVQEGPLKGAQFRLVGKPQLDKAMLTFKNLNKEQCTELISKLDTGWTSIKVGTSHAMPIDKITNLRNLVAKCSTSLIPTITLEIGANR